MLKINIKIIKKKKEKQDKIKEKNDLEVMLINLKSKQRSENLEVYEVPEGFAGPAIGDKWNKLQDTEGKYDETMQKAIQRMKELERELGRFNSLADKAIKWNEEKEKFLKEDIKQNDELPLIRAKINIMKSFSNEFKAIKLSAGKAFDVGQKVIDGEHSSAPEVKEKIEKIKKLLEETEKLEKEKSEKLDKTLKHLEDMEAKSVELSAKSDKLNSDMQSVNSHLSEPISVSSSKEVFELQTETDEHHKNHTDNRIKELEEITKLEKSIIEAGGDPTQYSNISAGGLKKKYDEIHGKMNQKKRSFIKRTWKTT